MSSLSSPLFTHPPLLRLHWVRVQRQLGPGRTAALPVATARGARRRAECGAYLCGACLRSGKNTEQRGIVHKQLTDWGSCLV